MMSYKGMRWFKSDLQMQTPADTANWRGTPLGDNKQDAADAFVNRCHEVKLECIGITDHNFASKDFLPEISAAIERATRTGKPRIWLFPGFEFQADVGKGIHVLALFDPERALNE